MAHLINPEPAWKNHDGSFTLLVELSDKELQKAKAKINRRVLLARARLKTFEKLQENLTAEINTRTEENKLMETIDNRVKEEQNV